VAVQRMFSERKERFLKSEQAFAEPREGIRSVMEHTPLDAGQSAASIPARCQIVRALRRTAERDDGQLLGPVRHS